MSGTDTSFNFPSAVGWADSVDEARQIAQLKKKPFAVYFAAQGDYDVVGANSETIKQYAGANGNTVPTVVFELPKVIDQFRQSGVVEFAKVQNDKENREGGKFGAESGFLVAIDPDGKKIEAWKVVGANLNNVVTNAKVVLEAWQKEHAK